MNRIYERNDTQLLVLDIVFNRTLDSTTTFEIQLDNVLRVNIATECYFISMSHFKKFNIQTYSANTASIRHIGHSRFDAGYVIS
ncbi:hypothetical protein FUT69_10390 [Xylella taiwanensis]|uniref:Uncharacterized protein n=1 Tax=Xylella taiwanensis TaxID=1444770 RepID=A0ABS8TST7_9GAMM|nr:hypothetical protein [Xylella taiwanensis]AXI82824.1 hypothetical protein AB672_02055 [Xylella taiwanensis]MCD8455835.1 hypothetical protein [Xylella taiwanensis]MCD8458240.1 hypothetical protein [Xylella taiwanensis]MCD8460377.1 hypothetical protein [Xylella taiwanensis]MCD8463565.1 hypothetical protein [Xylella taiwanensis]